MQAHAAAFFTVHSGANMIKFPDLCCVGFVCDALRKRISNSLTVRDAARRFRYQNWSSQWCPHRESRPIPSPGVRCIVLQIKEIASIICLSREWEQMNDINLGCKVHFRWYVKINHACIYTRIWNASENFNNLIIWYLCSVEFRNSFSWLIIWIALNFYITIFSFFNIKYITINILINNKYTNRVKTILLYIYILKQYYKKIL